MIINSNNKDDILKGTVKRGFNLTPRELQEKLFHEKNRLQKETKTEQITSVPEPRKSNKAINNLKNMK